MQFFNIRRQEEVHISHSPRKPLRLCRIKMFDTNRNDDEKQTEIDGVPVDLKKNGNYPDMMTIYHHVLPTSVK